MEQIVRVCRILPDGKARVIRIRESACSGDCHKCSGCGAARETLLFEAENPIGAVPGDVVTVTSGSGPVLAAAAVLYLIPVVLFFLGYAAGALLWRQGALTGCAAFLAGIGGAAVYDRKIARKRKMCYTITGFSAEQPLESGVKGDNDLD